MTAFAAASPVKPRPVGDVLVTGATGLLGGRVIACLARRDGAGTIYAGVRNPTASGSLPPGAIVLQLDITNDVVLPPRVRTLIHVAGEKRDEARMVPVNAVGTHRLMRAAIAAGIERFVHVSSVGVYGALPGAGRVDESAKHRPGNAYERSKEAGERALQSLRGTGSTQLVVIRPSNVIGFDRHEGRAPLLGLVRSIRRGVFTHFGPRGRAWLNYIGVDDVATAIVIAAERAPDGGEYIVNLPARLDDVVRWIATELGVTEPRRRLPVAMGRMLAAAVPVAASLLGRSPPFDRARLRELTNDTVFDPSRIERETGFHCQAGPESMYRSLARHYLETGTC